MNSYILFIYGIFDDHEDIEFFCMDILGQSTAIQKVRYVIESQNNLIVVFNSDYSESKLSQELLELCTNDNIKFYFLVEQKGIITSHLPEQVNDFIFKPKGIPENTLLKVEYKRKYIKDTDVDTILDKVSEHGIDSLTQEEKNILDNFEN